MTAEDAREQVPLYTAIADARDAERHISLVPHMPDLEAICGRPIRFTSPGPWRAVVTGATCQTCRSRGIAAARPIRACTPPQGLTYASTGRIPN